MVYPTVKNYFMPWGLGITFIECSYLHFCVVFFLFCSRSYWIWIIIKQGERTHRQKPKRLTPVRVELVVVAMKAFSTLQRSPEVMSDHLMPFSVIPSARIFFYEGFLLLCREYSQLILKSCKVKVNTWYMRDSTKQYTDRVGQLWSPPS